MCLQSGFFRLLIFQRMYPREIPLMAFTFSWV